MSSGSRNGDITQAARSRSGRLRSASGVREPFIAVNRLLSPPGLREVFEVYIEQALAKEIGRMAAYYSERKGGFWVAIQNDSVVGMFSLERASPDAMELRRMYVDPAARRAGIGRRLLCFAEEESRRRGVARLDLSTAEIQEAALALYRTSGIALFAKRSRRRQATRPSGPAYDGSISKTALRHRIGRFCRHSLYRS
jgi:ribosomal protein S18 acetylase RimI-like enzyme